MAPRQKSGQYFCVSLTEVKAITHLHLLNPSISPADADIISAYIILCRGAGKFNTTAWKAYGICRRTNLTSERTKLAISWLIDNGFLDKIPYDSDLCESPADIETESKISRPSSGQEQEAKYAYQISRHHTGKCVFLPNLLVDGQVGHESDPPLKRLLQESKPNFRLGIDSHDARLDAILLLLQLYGEQNIDSHGGINPGVWQGTWTYSERREEFEISTSNSSIDDSTFDFFSAQEEKEIFNIPSIDDMFSYIEDPSLRTRRLEHSLKQLRAFRFLYRVIQVWGRVHGSKKDYSIMYPLHIIDSAQRSQNEPAIGPKILELAAKYASDFEGIREEYDRINPKGGQDLNCNSFLNLNGVFFLAAKGFSMRPLTTLRLRYRAHDVDTAAGFAEQRRLVETWQQTLDSLVSYSYEQHVQC